MSQTFGGAGELYHALGVCAALKVELVLGPLQRGLSAFQLALQRGITDFWHPDGTRATIAPGLRAAATQLESAADDTEAAGRGDQKLKANVEEARRMARVVRELFDGSAVSPIYVTMPVVADASAGAGSPTADDEDGDIDLSGGDRVIPSDFFSGMRVRDAVFGLGRVLEVGPAASGQPHSGQVRIEYDDQGPLCSQRRRCGGRWMVGSLGRLRGVRRIPVPVSASGAAHEHGCMSGWGRVRYFIC